MTAPVRTLQRWTSDTTHWLQLADRNQPLLAGLGVAFIAIVVLTVSLVLMSFGGDFTSYSTLRAQLPAEGAAVALTSPVEYRDVTVGQVASPATGTSGGRVQVVLHLKPWRLKSIPGNVVATVAPISVFGNQYVVLVPPGSPRGTLRNGQTVPALTQGPTSTLQITLADLDRLLVEIHPAQLFSSLSAVANALQGQGHSIGATLVSFNSYLASMNPLWPKAVADFKLLAPVADNVASATPDLVATLANLTTTGTTINSQSAALDQLFLQGTTFANVTGALLTNIQGPYATLAAASSPFLNDLSQTPTTISRILQGLDSWARTWVAAEANGPYLTLNAAPIKVANAADLALGVLGGANVGSLFGQALGPGTVNPPTYSAADCPRYETLAGANCGGGRAAAAGVAAASTTAATTTAASPSSARAALLAALGPVEILPEPAQEQAVGAITAGLGNGAAPSSPDVATMLLSPVLTHMVGSR